MNTIALAPLVAAEESTARQRALQRRRVFHCGFDQKPKRAMRVVATRVQGKLFFVLFCTLLSGCRSRQGSAQSSIEFTKVPAASTGSPDSLDTIEGKVAGVRDGQQIVLYAKSDGLWWVQPSTDRPFTNIQVDSRWKASTHLGTDYAALLVEPGYTPSDTAEALPSPGAGVVAVGVTKGTGPQPPPTPVKKLQFSGYEWIVRRATSFRGGTGNAFSLDNAWADEKGALHLRIAKGQRQWTCAEVKLSRNLGYGTYVFTVRDTGHLEPAAVLSFFTWDDLGTEQRRRELDVEISRWGVNRKENAQYVVQPYYVPTNVFRFAAPAGVVTHSFRWEPGKVTFSSASRSTGRAHVVTEHTFTSGIPSAGGDSVHISLFVFGTGNIPLQNETEVVIEKFEYLP
jgi:hypothetical protein